MTSDGSLLSGGTTGTLAVQAVVTLPGGRESLADAEIPRHREADVAVLFRGHHVELVRLATLLLGDQATAEDVVQDVFARVYARWERLDAGGASLAYVRTAVVNGCRSVQRRRGVARRFGGTREAAPWSSATESAESAVLLAEDRKQVLRALAALPSRQREALVLRYYLCMSEAEIAVAMRISRGTVKSTTSRGLAALGRKIGEDDR